MKYPVYNQAGDKVKDIELNAAVFEMPVNEELVHQVLIAQEANARVPYAHTKQRAEVKGGGRKPWRQKGTGRARHGSIRSPLWKGGGVTFGPSKHRNFEKKINKKMKRKALLMTLSDKVESEQLILIDNFEIKEFKTKQLFTTLKNFSSKLALGKDGVKKDELGFKALIVTSVSSKELVASARNLPGIAIIQADSLNIKDILHCDWLIVAEKSLDIIEKNYVK